MDSLLTENQKKKIISHIASDEYSEIIAMLDPLKTDHAGTPKTKDKRFVIKEMVKHINSLPEPGKEFFNRGKYFCGIDDPMCRQFGASLIRRAYGHKPKEVEKYLLNIAGDPNWEVRETAGGAFAAVLAEHPGFYARLKEWAGHPSENVRRAVVISALGLMGNKNPSAVNKAFALLKPLMYDSSRYVKKNLGPFVIGSYYGNNFPGETLSTLVKWSSLKDEHVRWNIAMSFNNSFGNKYPAKALEVLALLAPDERKTVRRAVISTLRFLKKRHEKAVLDFIKAHGIKI
jgi:HEAT repeat protein